MKVKAKIVFLLSTVFLVSLACNLQSISPDANPTESNVLFQDDFSDPASGWDRITQEDGQTDYVDGVYRIFVNKTDTDVWANPGLTFTDVRVEVDATRAGGSQNNDFGITCRVTDPTHFYFLVISSDGYYGIGKVSGGSQSLIGMDAMQPHDQIDINKESHHLRADCIGNQLSLYVDGKLIGEAQDDEFSSGDVGLIAGSFNEPTTDIHFDNFSVQKP